MRYLGPAVVLLGLALAAPGLGQEVGGLWLSTSRSDEGLGVSLEFGSNQRLRATLGTTVAKRWTVKSRDGVRYVLELRSPFASDETTSIELRLGGGHPRKLVQTTLATAEKIKLSFVARGRQGTEPAFLGRWAAEVSGTRVTYDFNDDGWLWVRTPKRSFSGQYRLDGERLVPIWDGLLGPEFESLQLEGPVLVAEMASGSVEQFMRPKQAFKAAIELTSPSPAIQPLPAKIVIGQGLLEKKVFIQVETVGQVSHIVDGELDPAPGLELGIAGSQGAVLLGPGNQTVSAVSFEVDVGRVEIVDIERDGIAEYLDRGGGWQTVSLIDHAGKERWGYRTTSGTNNMAAGHLDGDGKLDFVVGVSGRSGVHRLGLEGDRQWQQADGHVWHVEILDTDGDGLGEIVYSNDDSELCWRNTNGTIIHRQFVDEELTDFSIFHPHDPGEPPQILFFSEKASTVRFIDLEGTAVSQLEVPLPPNAVVYGAWATPVQFETGGPVLTAIVLWLRQPFKRSIGGLFLYDKSARLVYREIADQELSTVATVAGDGFGSNRLLVGGDGVVWEYKRASDRLAAASRTDS